MLSLATNAEYRRKKREENLEAMKKERIRKDQEKYLKLKKENDAYIAKKHKETSSSKVPKQKKIVSWCIKTRCRKKTGEKEVFENIRNTRKHVCTICGKYITEAQARCFAHLLAKGMYPDYRLHDANIALVCGPSCHKAIDSMVLWHKMRIQQLLELWTSFNWIINTIWLNTTQRK